MHRPPTRRALISGPPRPARPSHAFVEPLSFLTLPRRGAGGKFRLIGGGGGRLHAYGIPPSGPSRPARRSPALSRLRRTAFGSHPPPPSRWREIFTFWWRGEDSNLRRLSRQIYSLIPLTAREPLQKRGGILWEGDITVNCVRLVAALTAKNTATPVVASRRLRQQRPRLHPTRAVCGGLIDDNPLRTLEKS
jgi:hypothetical protein